MVQDYLVYVTFFGQSLTIYQGLLPTILIPNLQDKQPRILTEDNLSMILLNSYALQYDLRSWLTIVTANVSGFRIVIQRVLLALQQTVVHFPTQLNILIQVRKMWSPLIDELFLLLLFFTLNLILLLLYFQSFFPRTLHFLNLLLVFCDLGTYIFDVT